MNDGKTYQWSWELIKVPIAREQYDECHHVCKHEPNVGHEEGEHLSCHGHKHLDVNPEFWIFPHEHHHPDPEEEAGYAGHVVLPSVQLVIIMAKVICKLKLLQLSNKQHYCIHQ